MVRSLYRKKSRQKKSAKKDPTPGPTPGLGKWRGTILGRRKQFRNDAAWRSDCERSERRAKDERSKLLLAQRVVRSVGSVGALSPSGGVRGGSPGIILNFHIKLKLSGATSEDTNL